MISQTTLTIFFIFAFVWFCVGFVLIAVPAIREIKNIISTGTDDFVKAVLEPGVINHSGLS